MGLLEAWGLPCVKDGSSKLKRSPFAAVLARLWRKGGVTRRSLKYLDARKAGNEPATAIELKILFEMLCTHQLS